MLFFPQDQALRDECKRILKHCAEKLHLHILGYRPVPVNNRDIGETAKAVEPVMEMLIIEKPFDIEKDSDFE